MKTAIFSIRQKKWETINSHNLALSGMYGSVVLPFNTDRLIFAKKRDLKGWFTRITAAVTSLTKVYSVNLVTVGIGYKFFTPKRARFLSTIVLKMGFGGAELAKRVPFSIRARAKKQKLILVGNDKARLGSFAKQVIELKNIIPYTAKGIKYKDQQISLKKRKQQQKSK